MLTLPADSWGGKFRVADNSEVGDFALHCAVGEFKTLSPLLT